jgi:hypothetical protein
LRGLAVAQGNATRVCDPPTRARAKAALVWLAPPRQGAPRPPRERNPPARAPLPAARMYGCRPAELPRHRPHVWRRPPPAHRGPAQAPSTPTPFRWKTGESCPRHAGRRYLKRVPPCRCQSEDGAGTPDSSRRSAGSAARSEDNSTPHLLAPWIFTVSPNERRPPSAGRLLLSRLPSNRTRLFRASWTRRRRPDFPLSNRR